MNIHFAATATAAAPQGGDATRVLSVPRGNNKPGEMALPLLVLGLQVTLPDTHGQHQ